MNAVSQDNVTWTGGRAGGTPTERGRDVGETARTGPVQLADFYGRDFVVTKDVLIPRPETEQLIDMTLSLAGKPYLPGVKPGPRELPEHPTILDVGTGSGCIAITIKKELPEATVYATDISEPALQVAQKNASLLDASITTIISHLLDKVNSHDIPTPDLVVANLPYVDETWPWLDKVALSKEPSLALYAKDHGLALIKELIIQASSCHIPRLILEADPCEHSSIASFAEEYGYRLVQTTGFILYMRLK